MKTGTFCPISDGDFSSGDEFSAYSTAKSPWNENSSRSWSRWRDQGGREPTMS
jgi:hypothetical protein